MEDFFAVPADAPEANNPHGNNRWASRPTRLCTYVPVWRERPVQDVLRGVHQTPQPSPKARALFQECFKMSYRDMMFYAPGYIDFTTHRTDIFKLKPGSPRFGGKRSRCGTPPSPKLAHQRAMRSASADASTTP